MSELITVPWLWLIAAYLFMGGLAGGTFVISFLAEKLGYARKRTLRWMDSASVVIILVSLIPLILDLGIPEDGVLFYVMHLTYAYMTPNPTSVIAWGIWLLTIFIIAAIVFCLPDWAEYIGFLKWLSPIAKLLKPLKSIARWVGMISGLGVCVYTGVFLWSVGIARPFWGALVPVLFTVSALSTGFALGEVFGVYHVAYGPKKDAEAEEKVMRWFTKSDAAFIIIELIIIAAYLISSSYAGAPASTSVELLTVGWLGSYFWIFIILGLVIPELLYAYMIYFVKRVEKRVAMVLMITFLAGWLILVGGYLLRYVWLYAGIPTPIPGRTIPLPVD